MDSDASRPLPETGNGLFRFSSDSIPERDRLAFVRDVYGRAIVKHDIEPFPGTAFYWHGSLRKLDRVGLASTVCSAVRTERTSAQINSDDLVLNITVAGRRVVRQFGREAVVDAQAGFADLSYFNCTFRQHYRAAPTEIRERGGAP